MPNLASIMLPRYRPGTYGELSRFCDLLSIYSFRSRTHKPIILLYVLFNGFMIVLVADVADCASALKCTYTTPLLAVYRIREQFSHSESINIFREKSRDIYTYVFWFNHQFKYLEYQEHYNLPNAKER
jgi:hypothetical protein